MALATESSGFRRQLLWQKAQQLAVDVVLLGRKLPRDNASDTSRQLVRSASSIAANIAEGYGRFSQGAYRNHLSIARGSAYESESWIDLLARAGYLDEESAGALIAQCYELQTLISYRMKVLDSRFPRRAGEEPVTYASDTNA